MTEEIEEITDEDEEDFEPTENYGKSERKKKVGVITIRDSCFTIDGVMKENGRDFKNGDKAIGIDFTGYQEGCGSNYTLKEIEEKSVEERVKELQERYRKSTEYDYTFKIVDERVKQTNLFAVEKKVEMKATDKPHECFLDVLEKFNGNKERADNFANKNRCPDCKGTLIPLKASEHFAICDKCQNGYNLNYYPPQIYYTHKTENNSQQKNAKSNDKSTEASPVSVGSNTQTHLIKPLSVDRQEAVAEESRVGLSKTLTNSNLGSVPTNQAKKSEPSAEGEKVNPSLCSCGNPIMWDINVRDKCKECNRKHFITLFGNLGEKGYLAIADNKAKFYSHTTGLQEVSLDRVSGVSEGVMRTPTFPKIIFIVDEFGCHQNTLGVTQDFADFLIRVLNMTEKEGNFINPKIVQDEKGKKLAELNKEIVGKTKELQELYAKKREMMK